MARSRGISIGLFVTCSCMLWHIAACSPPPAKVDVDLIISTRTPEATAATTTFWEILHANRIEDLESVLADLQAAYDADPEDAVVARFIGYGYAWMGLEHARLDEESLDALEIVRSAKFYLDRARQLDPSNRAALGFGTSIEWVLGILENDPDLVEASYQKLLDNTEQDPRFHGFIQGWVMSAMLPTDDPRYPEAIDGYFATFDSCAGFAVPRNNISLPTFALNALADMARTQDSGCYNSDMVPHNIEATMLGLGDALLKNGQIDQARSAYRSIRSLPSYETWDFKDVLETRLANLETLSAKFQADTGRIMGVQEPAMTFQSNHACTSCHAQ